MPPLEPGPRKLENPSALALIGNPHREVQAGLKNRRPDGRPTPGERLPSSTGPPRLPRPGDSGYDGPSPRPFPLHSLPAAGPMPESGGSNDVNQRLVEQYTEIARLAGGLAHEIKNPLSTIRLNMELLAEDFVEGQSQRERRAMRKVEVVQRECQRLQDVLDDFLNFAKASQLHLEPSDLNAQVTDLLDFYRPKAAEAGIEVVDYLAADLPSVVLDREAFRGALLNLMLNAEQAMPDGGQLVVRTYVTADGVALDLIDTGCGMEPSVQAKIFDAFFSTKRGGSGLGLPTVRKIIEAHGGGIKLQSEPQRGTQFTIKLPVPARLSATSA